MIFKPGDRVIYEGGGTKEYGIVVHTWRDEQDDLDCLVAFFGEGGIPEGMPSRAPYVLEYYADALTKVEA